MSAGPSASTQQSSTWTEPPWSGWIETTGDALLILEAARRGLIPRVTRRLVDSERKMITSGSVFVFDEDESGIKRWTDGFFWSPSRILGNFLIYRETEKRGAGHRSRMDPDMSDAVSPDSSRPEAHSLSRPKTDSTNLSDKQRERTLMGSLTNSDKFKPEGLFKKTFSVTIGGVAQHLISYYKVEDVTNGRLRSPSSLPELASLDISPEYLDKTHFRNPPKVEIGVDGIPRYRGEGDDMENSPSIPTAPLSSGMPLLTEGRVPEASANKRGKRFDPYGSPHVPKRQRRNTKSSQPDSTGTPTADSDSPEASVSSSTPQPVPEPLPPTAAVPAYPDLNMSAAAPPPPAPYPAYQFYHIAGYPPPPHGGQVYAAAALPPQQAIPFPSHPGTGSSQVQAQAVPQYTTYPGHPPHPPPPPPLPPQQSSPQLHSSDPSQTQAGLQQAPPPAQGPYYPYYPPPPVGRGQYPPYQWPVYSGYPPQPHMVPQYQPPPHPPLAPPKPADGSGTGVGGGGNI
ncbi:hypothetical protein M413DRAFT_443127 [Hebeloma cylindrosporum]|uniref:Gti1/Pac2 family protein n=1 Tax=Hebeloma cylindrosporum TaxID=76867 RepID=A0A0C2Y2K6_HEBCY|nr:hypothetical protein M413DRAFT_443127 [Hebeloma cylindrosporum h7]